MQSEESLMEREWTIETSHHCCDIDIPFLQAPWIHWLDEKFHSDLLLQSHPKGESDKQVYKQIIRILSLSGGFGSWGGRWVLCKVTESFSYALIQMVNIFRELHRSTHTKISYTEMHHNSKK